jgi:hypothetical protein
VSASDFFSDDLRRDVLIQREIGHQALQLRVLFAQLALLADLAAAQVRVLPYFHTQKVASLMPCRHTSESLPLGVVRAQDHAARLYLMVIRQLVLNARRAAAIVRDEPAPYLIAFMCGIVAMSGAVLHPATRSRDTCSPAAVSDLRHDESTSRTVYLVRAVRCCADGRCAETLT